MRRTHGPVGRIANEAGIAQRDQVRAVLPGLRVTPSRKLSSARIGAVSRKTRDLRRPSCSRELRACLDVRQLHRLLHIVIFIRSNSIGHSHASEDRRAVAASHQCRRCRHNRDPAVDRLQRRVAARPTDAVQKYVTSPEQRRESVGRNSWDDYAVLAPVQPRLGEDSLKSLAEYHIAGAVMGCQKQELRRRNSRGDTWPDGIVTRQIFEQ